MKEMVRWRKEIFLTATRICRPPKGKKQWLDFFLMQIPLLKWVWGYKCSYIIGDIIAGITVAIMHIPQGML